MLLHHGVKSPVALPRQCCYWKQRTRVHATGDCPALSIEGDSLRDQGCLSPPNPAISHLAESAPSLVVIVEGCFPELIRMENCRPPFSSLSASAVIRVDRCAFRMH